VDCSDVEEVAEALARRRGSSPNFLDVMKRIGAVEGSYGRELYESVYREAYGADFAAPRATPGLASAFRRALGDHLFEELKRLSPEERPFHWLLVPTSETDTKCRRVLFVRHDDRWLVQHERDWKLAFAYAEVDAGDEDVMSCVLYQIVSSFLLNVIRSVRPHQLQLVKRRVDINALKALLDTEDSRLLTRLYLVTDVLLDSHFCANSTCGGIMFLREQRL
jgi:hypothetical protein